MDRLICAGLFLLALVIAALFYNIGFIVNPEYGLFDDSFYSKDGLANVSYIFTTASAVTSLSGCLALVGCFWVKKAQIITSISIVILVIAGSVAWWCYSKFFYAVM